MTGVTRSAEPALIVPTDGQVLLLLSLHFLRQSAVACSVDNDNDARWLTQRRHCPFGSSVSRSKTSQRIGSAPRWLNASLSRNNPADVCFWHEADIDADAGNFRSKG